MDMSPLMYISYQYTLLTIDLPSSYRKENSIDTIQNCVTIMVCFNNQ